MLFDADALWESQAASNVAPGDPGAVAVPAAGWSAASKAPFGTIGLSFVTDLEINTPWATGAGRWFRRALVVDGQAAVRLRLQVSNACFVYLDGEWVGTVNPLDGPHSPGDVFEVVIPQALATEGTHTLAVLCVDDSTASDGTTLFYMTGAYLPAMIPLWPGTPLNEAISWLNDVTIYEDGSESRERLRIGPRHQLRETYFVPHVHQPRIVNLLFGAREEQWLVPLWSQAQNIGAVNAGLIDLNIPTAQSEYRAGGLALLWESPTKWQVIGVDDSVWTTTFDLDALDARTDYTQAPVYGGFGTTDLVTMTLPEGERFEAHRMFNDLGNKWRTTTYILGDGSSEQIVGGAGADDPATARANFPGATLTGHNSYAFLLADDVPADNLGGLSIKLAATVRAPFGVCLTLPLTTLTEEFTDAWIMPVRLGYMDSDPTRSFNGRTSKLEASYAIEDNAQLVVAAPAQYLGNDVYFEPGLLEGNSLDEAMTTRLDIADEDLGLVTYWSPWANNRPGRTHRMLAEDQAEAWAIREWLHRRSGRLRPFWHPSFEVDMRVLSTGALTTTLTVALDDYLRFGSARDHIAVETDGGWLPRAITSTLQTGPNALQLTLDASLAVDASAIKRVCFLGLRRMAADRVELTFSGGTTCSCAVPVLDIAP